MSRQTPVWTVEVLRAIASFEADQVSVEEVQVRLQEILAANMQHEAERAFDLVDLAENELENILFTTLLAEHRPSALACLSRLRQDLSALPDH